MSQKLLAKTATALAAVCLYAAPVLCQTTSGDQNLTFQVSATQAWTDTGLDLQTGDAVKISATAMSASSGQSCDPKGGGDGSSDLPLPSAAAGSLIARLHAQSTPVFVGTSGELHAEDASHLYLGMNGTGTPACQGGLTVKVEKIPTSASGQQSRGQQLKSQLGTAAQVFMSGQFGINEPNSGSSSGGSNATSSGAAPEAGTATAAASLKLSTATLDSGLRKSIDGLPRRVNDQFNNLGDMVNFVIVGSEADVQAALDAANWHVADTNNKRAVLNALMQTYDNKDYLAMPMSTLYLFGRKQDFGYEMAEPIAMVASRHHFRIWKTAATWNGHEIWCGAGTHDIGFAKDKRNNEVTHKIDPAVDGERDNIGSSLQKGGKVKTLTYYLPPDPVQDAKNATGDGYHSDGRMLVILLQ